MSSQPSPYSTQSDDQQDAARWRRFVRLLQAPTSEMTQDEWDCWMLALRGREFVDDLTSRLDALIASDEPSRGGDAGAEQE